MKTLPKISIIIPVYNVAEYITECLQSVMRQTYKGEIECILVDDCGKDVSVAIAERLIADYKGAIDFQIVHHERNRGLSAARNTGTDVATGEYIYYLDSDDYVSDDCIEKLVKPLKEKEYDIVLGDYEIFGDITDMSLLIEKRESIIGNKKIFSAYADRMIYVMAWNKLVKLSFLRNNDITFLEGQLHEDDLWTYKCMLHIDSIAIVHNVTYYYRMRSNSIITDITKIAKKANSVADTLMYIQSHPYENETDYNKCIIYYWGRYLQLAFTSGEAFYARYRELRRLCSYSPQKLSREGKMTIGEFKKRIHFALPVRLGYWYLKIRNFKNKHA